MSLLAALPIGPLKVISGMRRTATGLPAIADVAAPGVRPVNEGTDPAARRSVRAGRSAAGQITDAVIPAAPARRAEPKPPAPRESAGAPPTGPVAGVR
jgi:hypothetical protein